MKCDRGFLVKCFVFCLLLNCAAFSQVIKDSAYFLKPGKIINNWEFFDQDNLSIKDSTFPSSTKTVKSIYFDPDSFDLKHLNKVVWFRKKFQIDPSFINKDYCLWISISGAAQVYIEQQHINDFGTVSDVRENEVLISSDIQRISYPFIPGKEYMIAIRYSNHDIEGSYNSTGDNMFGLKIKLEESDEFFGDLISKIISTFSFGIIISAFFFTLAFVHFVIFLFYREEKANAYYAFFCLAASTLVGASVFKTVAYYDSVDKMMGVLIAVSPAIIFTLLPYMLRSFFKLKFPKWYYGFIILFFVLIPILYISIDLFGMLYVVLVLVSVVETIRNIIIAIRDKIKGVKIIGIGTSFFLLLVIVILVLLVFQISANATGNNVYGLSVLLLVLLCIFSIPISITIFLSYQISLTNKSLKQKLGEVEELSRQTIEQEKEKQKILLNQKSMLEEQVLERTVEITEQKKIIEEKNKDIIDSINYAKRIQTSILPEINYFRSVFSNSFIIYEPRDIVSGDFYYVTEINGSKILFIADCTGHGVPGALMSMVGSNLINKIIHENKVFEPKDILQTLHIELRHALKQDQEGSLNRDGMDAAVVVIKDNKLFYAGANRSLLYFNNNKELCEIKPTKTPIGGSHITSIDITQHTLDIQEIIEFYLYSDGFADQFGGPALVDKHSGKKLMLSRFKKWLTDIFDRSLQDKETYLTTEFKKWKGDLEQVDDVMVICVKPGK